MSSLNLLASYDTDSHSESESETSAVSVTSPEAREHGTGAEAANSRSFFSASASDSSDSEDDASKSQNITRRVIQPGALVNPFRQSESGREDPTKPGEPQSVFSNPFTAAELAEKSALEKHVKLAPRLDDVTIINGRRICWNYRKGRCRFGANCVYAHDSEIIGRAHKREWEVEPPQSTDQANTLEEEDHSETRKKRPGLTQGLVPGKKVMKLYHRQKGNL